MFWEAEEFFLAEVKRPIKETLQSALTQRLFFRDLDVKVSITLE